MLDLKSCKGTCEVLIPTNSPVSPAPHFLLHLSLVKAKQQLFPANLCANLLSRIKKPLQIQLAVPVKTSADVKANDLLILMCAWHQAPLRGCWDLSPRSFAWPWCRLVLNLNSAEPSWEEEAQETAATTRHLLASHQVSMALPSYLCLKVSQWLPKGKRASQWDLGGKPNSRHSLLSTSPAITEPFSFFLFICFDPASKLLLPLDVDFSASTSAFFPISAHMHNHRSSLARGLWSLRKMKTPVAYSACPMQGDCSLPRFYLVQVIQV